MRQVSETVRGLIIFVSVLITVGIWMPISNSPRIVPEGGTVTETYFGVFRYGTMTGVMKEPEFSLGFHVHVYRLILTIFVTLLFWVGVILYLRASRRSASNRTETE